MNENKKSNKGFNFNYAHSKTNHSLAKPLKKEIFSGCKNPFYDGVMMWTLLMLGYFVFILSWTSTVYVQSVKGFTGDPFSFFNTAGNTTIQTDANGQHNIGLIFQFYPPNGPDQVITRATNYTITLGRAIGSVFFGWLITKINHKYSVLIAMGLMIAAFPYLLSSFAVQDPMSSNAGAYAMFIIFRMLLAIGGTTLITYANGVIAVCTKEKKRTFTQLNAFSYNIASIIASIFLLSPIIKVAVALNWQLLDGSIEIILLVIFIAYAIFGRKIDMTQKKIEVNRSLTQENFCKTESCNAMLQILKKRQTYLYLGGLMFANFITVEPTTQILENFWRFSPYNNDPTSISNLGWIFGVFNMAYLGGLFLGRPVIGQWLKTKYSYHLYAGIVTFAGALFMAAAGAIGYTGMNNTHIIFMVLMAFCSGICIFGVQGINYFMPMRWEYTPAQTTALTSLQFGVGYTSFTILDVITSAVLDAGLKPYETLGNATPPGSGQGAIPAICIMLIVPIGTLICRCFMTPEHDAIKFSFKDLYHRYLRKDLK